ncbi:MAG: hypothetical protein FWE59_04135 [Oscillospiraceae bacterium]|nr:hypothetical protein [Oscillospiraceae bacterium]
MKRNIGKSLLVSGLAFLLCLVLFSGVSYAWFAASYVSEDNQLASSAAGFSVAVDFSSVTPDGGGGYALASLSGNRSGAITVQLAPKEMGGAWYFSVENSGGRTAKVYLYMRIEAADLVKQKANLAEVVKLQIEKCQEGGVLSVDGPSAYRDLDVSTLATMIKEIKAESPEMVTQVGDYITVRFDLGQLDQGDVVYYRLDYAMFPGAGATYGDKSFELDFMVVAMQENADLDTVVFLNKGGDLQELVSETREGATIIFLDDYTCRGGLLVDLHHNFDLNGHTLTVLGDVLVSKDIGGLAIEFSNGTLVADNLIFDEDLDIIVNLVDVDLGETVLVEGGATVRIVDTADIGDTGDIVDTGDTGDVENP